MVKIDKIIEYFENHYDYDFNKYKDTVIINEHTKITNLQTFLISHISILKSNPKNKRYMPYYERLLKVYLIARI